MPAVPPPPWSDNSRMRWAVSPLSALLRHARSPSGSARWCGGRFAFGGLAVTRGCVAAVHRNVSSTILSVPGACLSGDEALSFHVIQSISRQKVEDCAEVLLRLLRY